ncbi:hypothetical protein DET47_10414 [Shewanella putrefaciens]|nr:hypothetical protein DET47_10414 [Shewanella putrefaciens]
MLFLAPCYVIAESDTGNGADAPAITVVFNTLWQFM